MVPGSHENRNGERQPRPFPPLQSGLATSQSYSPFPRIAPVCRTLGAKRYGHKTQMGGSLEVLTLFRPRTLALAGEPLFLGRFGPSITDFPGLWFGNSLPKVTNLLHFSLTLTGLFP